MADQFWVMFTCYANGRPRQSYVLDHEPVEYDGYSYGHAPAVYGPHQTKSGAEAEAKRIWAEDTIRDDAGRAWWR